MKQDSTAPGSTATGGPKKSAKASRLEAKGLLVVSILLLLYAVVRYWHNIPWSLR